MTPATDPRSPASPIALDLLPGEGWYGGMNADGHLMPFTAETTLERDLLGESRYNQACPLLVSDRGRWVWSDQPFAFAFEAGTLTVRPTTEPIQHGRSGSTLREAFLAASAAFFPPQGETPGERMFLKPQYNTWIELMYEQEQSAIVDYAETLLRQGYPDGLLMIDDNWQEDIGVWEFSGARFEDPKAMVERLHGLGFSVMLWVCPFVSPDCGTYRDLDERGLLVVDAQKRRSQRPLPSIVHWWNGASAVLDLGHPGAVAWFHERLEHLVDAYGVDGFKLDAGDAEFYTGTHAFHVEGSTANDQTRAFGEVGLRYPLNEYRACWKLGGQPLAQRLKDKAHTWGALRELVPDLLAQGLIGHPFVCPDMIGGGEFKSFLQSAEIDEELVVRSAQVHALMPMMQFSVAPWRVLSPENNAICRDMALLHTAHGEEILALAKEAAQTGEPIARSLDYQHPGAGYAGIADQFFLGPDLLVAPVLESGARSRRVVLPAGTWEADDGSTTAGPAEVEVRAPLERLPRFRRTG